MRKQKTKIASTRSNLPDGYGVFLDSLKHRVRNSQAKAMLSVNRDLVSLYWDIGREIAKKQDHEGWGRNVVDRLAEDIQVVFPGISGFSRRNVFRMRAFFKAYGMPGIVAQPVRQTAENEKVAQPVREAVAAMPQAVAEIPWGHNIGMPQKRLDTSSHHEKKCP